MLKFYLETFGCQMNQLDSELVETLLRGVAYEKTQTWDDADLVLFNTCSVREHAESKVYSRLGVLRAVKQRRPGMIIAVIGCMAEQEGKTIAERNRHVDVICGPGNLHLLAAMIQQAAERKQRLVALDGEFAEMSTPLETVVPYSRVEDLDSERSASGQANAFQAYLRISRGCNKFCTYCVVPYARGREVHRSPEEILSEAKRLADTGVVELTLLGQTVNHWHYEHGDGRRVSFADLLKKVHDAVPSVRRLRFVTSYPRDFTVETLQVMAESPRIGRYLHLPAQSGSNAVLERMNRGYTVEQYLDLVDSAKRIVPGLQLAGDMIVGFCGETDADAEASLELMRRVRYMNCYMFKYSPRPGTIAAKRYADDVPEAVKQERHAAMFALQNSVCLENNQAMVGRTVEVLVEGPSKMTGRPADVKARTRVAGQLQLCGRTVGDQVVVFDGPLSLVGQFVEVAVEEATTLTLHGRIAGGGESEGRGPRPVEQQRQY
jgi:tRNA-2-methylthio-N6-dimethylallyladenosine synthase